MISSPLDEPELETLLRSSVLEDDIQQDVKDKLQLFLDRLREGARFVLVKSYKY